MIKFNVGGTAYGDLPPIVDSAGLPVVPTSVTFKTYKNGSTTATGDSVTLITHSDDDGLYGWSYNPAGESEFDVWRLQVKIVIDGVDYYHHETIQAVVAERGTDDALQPTIAGRTIDIDSNGYVERVVLTDTTTTNTDMRGTDNAALAATALSTAVWTNTLATNLGTAASTIATNLDIAISVIQSQITALNNLSAKANWYGALLLEVPDSGTRAYIYELVVRDDEDKLANLDGLPTIALTNAAGTDRSSLITTTIANPSTGQYTLTITVGTSTDNESLKLAASGTVSGEARYAVIAPQVVDYDNATQVALILTRLGTPVVSVSDDIAAVKADTAATLADTGTDGVKLSPTAVRDIFEDDWFGVTFPPDTSGYYIQHIHDQCETTLTKVTTIEGAVGDLPTNSELATALAAADDAVLAAISALNNLSAAEVNAEVLDVLNVDTFGELSAPPAASSSLRDKLTWVFMWARNRSTETATQRKLYADNATTVVSTEAVSDDGTTFEKGEAS